MKNARLPLFDRRIVLTAGVDALNVSAPWAGQSFVSPKLHRELLAPAQAVLVAAAREGGVPSYCHTCGAIGDRLEAIIDTGFDGIECLDPPPLGNVELADEIGANRCGDSSR